MYEVDVKLKEPQLMPHINGNHGCHDLFDRGGLVAARINFGAIAPLSSRTSCRLFIIMLDPLQVNNDSLTLLVTSIITHSPYQAANNGLKHLLIVHEVLCL